MRNVNQSSTEASAGECSLTASSLCGHEIKNQIALGISALWQVAERIKQKNFNTPAILNSVSAMNLHLLPSVGEGDKVLDRLLVGLKGRSAKKIRSLNAEGELIAVLQVFQYEGFDYVKYYECVSGRFRGNEAYRTSLFPIGLRDILRLLGGFSLRPNHSYNIKKSIDELMHEGRFSKIDLLEILANAARDFKTLGATCKDNELVYEEFHNLREDRGYPEGYEGEELGCVHRFTSWARMMRQEDTSLLFALSTSLFFNDLFFTQSFTRPPSYKEYSAFVWMLKTLGFDSEKTKESYCKISPSLPKTFVLSAGEQIAFPTCHTTIGDLVFIDCTLIYDEGEKRTVRVPTSPKLALESPEVSQLLTTNWMGNVYPRTLIRDPHWSQAGDVPYDTIPYTL